MIRAALACGVAGLGLMLVSPPALAAQPGPLPVTITLTKTGFPFRDIAFRAPSVRLTVVNHGTAPHGVAIYRKPDGRRVAGTGAIAPGGSKTLRFSLKAGRYRMASPVDHDAAHGFSVPMRVMSMAVGPTQEMDRVFYNY